MPRSTLLLLIYYSFSIPAHADFNFKNYVENSGYKENNEINYPNEIKMNYPESGVQLGQSWNTFSGEKIDSLCINFAAMKSGGQKASVDVMRIFESDLLRKELNVSYSVSAKASFGSFGGNLTQKSEFINNSELSNSSVTVLIKASVVNGVEFVTAPNSENPIIDLNNFAKSKLITKKGKEIEFNDFLNKCGDSYVESIQRGAELFALFNYSEEKATNEEIEKRKTSVSASGFGASGDISRSSSKSKLAVKEKKISNIKYMHSAHKGLRLPSDEESIYTSMSYLGNALDDQDAQPFYITLRRYDSLPTWSYGQIPNGDLQREVLMSHYLRINDLINQNEFFLGNTDIFRFGSFEDILRLNLLSEVLQKEKETISSILKKCETLKSKNNIKQYKDMLEECANRQDDTNIQDYFFRLLMPVKNSEMLDTYKIEDRSKIENEIRIVSEQLSKKQELRLNLHLTVKISCNTAIKKGISNKKCNSLFKRKKDLNNKLRTLTLQSELPNIAESRFYNNIYLVYKSRKDNNLVNSDISEEFIKMLKIDLYCQYSISYDGMSCPKVLFQDLLRYGFIHSKREMFNVNISVPLDPNSNPENAWNETQVDLYNKLAEISGGNPFSYKIYSSEYESALNINEFTAEDKAEASSFSVNFKGEVVIYEAKDNIAIYN